MATAMLERLNKANVLKERIENTPRLRRRARWRPVLANLQVGMCTRSFAGD